MAELLTELSLIYSFYLTFVLIVSVTMFPIYIFWKARDFLPSPLNVVPKGLMNVWYNWVFTRPAAAIYSVSFLLNAPDILLQNYTSRIPYVIQTTHRSCVVLSSECHVKELSRAQGSKLSFIAVIEEMFQTAHTMNRIEMHHSNVHHRALRSFLSNLPTMQLPMQKIIKETVIKELDKQNVSELGWKSVGAYYFAEEIVGHAIIFSFFGDSNMSKSCFLATAQQYMQDVFFASEILQFTPGFLASVVAYTTTRGHRALKTLRQLIIPKIQECYRTDGTGEDYQAYSYVRCLAKMYDRELHQPTSDMVQQILALWFAAMHQTPMVLTYALYDLCLHPECVEPLRQEMVKNCTTQVLSFETMPLLDSFLKESTRLSPPEAISLRRKALSDNTLADGTRIDAGDWTCVPLRAMGLDDTRFPSARTFDAWRFVGSNSLKQRSFTELDASFPFWGFGKGACPGRHFASVLLKTIIMHILQHYDLRLKDETAPRIFSWRSTVIPRPSTKLLFRRRYV